MQTAMNETEQFTLQNNLPEREQLLRCSSEEAAMLVLRFFGSYNGGFVPGDIIGNIADRAYGRDAEIERVLFEGASYLERYGLLIEEARRYSGTGRGRQLSRQGEVLAKSPRLLDTFIAQFKDPRSLLHAEITAQALPHFDKGAEHFEIAVFAAFKAVEVAVRDASGLSQDDIGVPLMNKAFGPTGTLRDASAEKGEEEGIRNLFAGSIATYKNPSSHRYVGRPDPKRTLNALILASELLSIVDERRSSPST
jgi:uncharacterized protein (TIGR02391 family)